MREEQIENLDINEIEDNTGYIICFSLSLIICTWLIFCVMGLVLYYVLVYCFRV